MPRITTANKHQYLDEKIEVYEQLATFEPNRRSELTALKYEKQWLTAYHDLEESSDKDRYSENKGFDLSIQDELAAKYGLGPSDVSVKAKNVYADYKRVKVQETDAKKNVAKYELQCSGPKVEEKEKSILPQTFEIEYPVDDFKLEAPIKAQKISGAILKPGTISFVKSTEQNDCIEPDIKRKKMDEQSPQAYLTPEKHASVSQRLLPIAYRPPNVPAFLCRQTVMASQHQYYLKIVTDTRHPLYQIECMCKRRALLKSNYAWTLLGDVPGIQVLGRMQFVYYLKIPYHLIGERVSSKLHAQEEIDDQFLFQVIHDALEAWERRKRE